MWCLRYTPALVCKSSRRRCRACTTCSRLAGCFWRSSLSPNPLWDIVFGRYVGWWQGGGNGAEGSPLRSAEEWRDSLVELGFGDPGAAALTNGPWPSAMVWGRGQRQQDTAATTAAPACCINLIAGNPPGATAFYAGLANAGLDVREIGAGEFAAAGGREAEDATADDGEIALFVAAADEGGDDPVEEAAQLLSLITAAAAAAARRRMPLWLATCGAQQLADAGQSGLVGATAWGLGRALINEMPGLSLRLIDFAPEMSWAARADGDGCRVGGGDRRDRDCVDRLSPPCAAPAARFAAALGEPHG